MDFMGFLGGGEILVIMVVTLVVFGPKRLPELARHLAKGAKMFRDASRELQKQLDMSDFDLDAPPKTKSISSSSDSEDDGYSYPYDPDGGNGTQSDSQGEEEESYPDYTDEYIDYDEGKPESTFESTSKTVMKDAGVKTEDAARFQREIVE